jgi:hypothetical protein
VDRSGGEERDVTAEVTAALKTIPGYQKLIARTDVMDKHYSYNIIP